MEFPFDFIMGRGYRGIEFIKLTSALPEILFDSSKRTLFKSFLDETRWLDIFRFGWSHIFPITFISTDRGGVFIVIRK